MRMWMVDTSFLCRKHLLGEHVETHMFKGSLRKKNDMSGYIRNNLFQPLSLKKRHDELAAEMLKRGFDHKSPMEFQPDVSYLPELYQNTMVNIEGALKELLSRCPDCAKRYERMEDANRHKEIRGITNEG